MFGLIDHRKTTDIYRPLTFDRAQDLGAKNNFIDFPYFLPVPYFLPG